MRQGEVWWAHLEPPIGRRPVLLLSRDSAYLAREQVTVALVTRTVRRIPAEVPLDQADGMPEACVVNLDSMVTIEKGSLERQVTALPEDKMRQVARAIVFALDLRRYL